MPENKEIRTSNISENEMFKTIVSLSKTNDKLSLTIERLEETIDSLNKTNADLQEQLKAKDEQMIQLIEQTRALTALIYGKRSEKRSRKSKEKSDKGDSDDQGGCAPSAPVGKKPAESKKKVSTHRPLPKKNSTKKPKSSIEDFIDKYHPDVETIYCDLSEEEKLCAVCGHPLEQIGEKLLRYSLDITLPKVIVKKYMGRSYSCPQCKRRAENSEEESHSSPITAKAPLSVLPGSYASAKLLSLAIGLKTVFMIPVNRMITILRELGSVSVSVGTLSTWIIKTAQIYFKPLYDVLKRNLLGRDHLQADETTLQVINESHTRKKRRSYLWQYRTVETDICPIVLFEYCQGRSGSYAAKFLEGFEGVLLVDGFTGYNKVENARLAHCWVHARRYFIEASICSSSSKVKSVAEEAMEYFDRIFEIEQEIADQELDLEGRVEWRVKNTLPVVSSLFEWIRTLNLKEFCSEKLRRAVSYLLSHEEGLKAFLHDPLIPAHNNRAEAAFVPVARGRNNWLFAYSPEGAEALAILFSITQTAKMCGLNVFSYLEHVMEKLRFWRDKTVPEEVIEELLPWKEEVRSFCPNLG